MIFLLEETGLNIGKTITYTTPSGRTGYRTEPPGGSWVSQWIYNTLLININFDPDRPQSNPNANMIHPPHSPGSVVLPNIEIPTGGNIFPTNDDCPLALD